MLDIGAGGTHVQRTALADLRHERGIIWGIMRQKPDRPGHAARASLPTPSLARARCWRTAARSLLAHAARALLAHARGARIAILVMGTPPSALQGHGDGQQQVVMQLPLMRRERLRLQAQQHGAGCRLVAFRHVEQTGGSSVREWMLRLDRMGQARFYGQTTRCAPPLADRYAPAQTVP